MSGDERLATHAGTRVATRENVPKSPAITTSSSRPSVLPVVIAGYAEPDAC